MKSLKRPVLIDVSPDMFKSHITSNSADKFAKTFVAKAKVGGDKYWDNCTGLILNGELLGAIIVTVSIRKPHVANLQLLHVFAKHRYKNIGRALVEEGLKSVIERADYFRVSSEIPAIPFYKKLGFKMLGEQKSRCQLSMFKINGPKVEDGIFDIEDPIINKAVYKKGRGGCVKVF